MSRVRNGDSGCPLSDLLLSFLTKSLSHESFVFPRANDCSHRRAAYPSLAAVGSLFSRARRRYVGAIPQLQNFTTKDLVGRLLGVESVQDAVIRTLLYERAFEKVEPYGVTVAELTNKLSGVRNELGKCGLKDKGVIVPKELGPEGRTVTEVLSSGKDTLSFSRTLQEIARILYGSGNEHIPGGFFPQSGNGRIARSFLFYP